MTRVTELYVQIEDLKIFLSKAIICTRNAKILKLRDRFEHHHDEGNNEYCQIDITKERNGHLVFWS